MDVSIYDQLPSPLLPIKNESNGGYFITQRFSAYHIATTASYPDAIDHQFVSGRLYDYYTKDSAFVWRIDQYISNYASTCSDHFPVISRYSSRNNNLQTYRLLPFNIYPVPTSSELFIESEDIIQSVNLIDLSGRVIPLNNNGKTWRLEAISAGLYFIDIKGQNNSFRQLINIL